MMGDIVRIKEGSEEGEWLGHVQCDSATEACVQGYQESLIIMDKVPLF